MKGPALAVLVLTAVLAGGAAAAPVPSPAHLPTLARTLDEPAGPPSRQGNYDVLDYDLELAIDPEALQIDGRVQVALQPLGGDVDRIVLDLVGNLTCDAVTRGAENLIFRHNGDSLVVLLPAALTALEPDTLTIAYHGRPLPHGAFNAGFMWRSRDTGLVGDPSDDTPIIATVVEPWSAHSWWPCKDDPADKATVGLGITVPDGLEVVANGTLLGIEPVTGGRHRYSWRETYPIATYLVSLAVTDYVSWSEDCLPAVGPAVRLDFHVFAEDSARAVVDLAPTCDMMEMMTGIAGPWPFAGEKYAQAEIRWVGAMEHQTATSISQFLLTGDRANETTVVHELAHQWYGDSLTPKTWQDIWLNEGFARYCEALWVEQEYGAEAYGEFMQNIGRLRHPDLFAGEGILADPDPILPNILIYNKGAWVLHLLRLLIGDDAFFTFLHDYPNDPALALGGTDTAAMIGHAEQAAGRSLEAFFTPLLQTDAVPVIQAEVTLSPAAVNLVQRQDPPFELPVPVRIFTGSGSQDTVLDLASRSQTFSLAGFGKIDSVQVDPENLSLMRRSPAPDRSLEIRIPVPNPGPQTEFMIYLKDYTQVTVNIYDARGFMVDSRGLGWLDPTGPSGDDGSLPHLFRWPDGPAAPASGVYWLRICAGRHQTTTKFTLLH